VPLELIEVNVDGKDQIIERLESLGFSDRSNGKKRIYGKVKNRINVTVTFFFDAVVCSVFKTDAYNYVTDVDSARIEYLEYQSFAEDSPLPSKMYELIGKMFFV